MTTMRAWIDEVEIDWSTPSPAPTMRARRPAPRARAGRSWVAWLLWAVVAAGAGTVVFGLVDDDGADRLPPAPELRAPDAGESATARAASPPAATLNALAHCESRGDPAAVSPDGRYRGKYQFDMATWRSVGGAGDPALASEAEQDRRARALAADRGTAPWPVCGPAVAGR